MIYDYNSIYNKYNPRKIFDTKAKSFSLLVFDVLKLLIHISLVHNTYRNYCNEIIPSIYIRSIISLYNAHISVLLITVKYTAHSSFRLHFLSINGNGIYLRLKEVPFLRVEKKFRSRVRAVRIILSLRELRESSQERVYREIRLMP